MFKLFGKSAAGRDVLFVGIEKGNVDTLVRGDPLIIHGQDFAPHVREDFRLMHVTSMAAVRMYMAIRNPLRCDVYDHSAFFVEHPTLLHVVIDSFVIDLIQQGGLSILTTAKIGWTTDVYLFYRESLQGPGDVEAAEQWLRGALVRMQSVMEKVAR